MKLFYRVFFMYLFLSASLAMIDEFVFMNDFVVFGFTD